MSRAVIYETCGGPEVLEVREVPEPHAGPGEVRVRVRTVGLDPMDGAFSSRPEMAARFGLTVPSGFGYDFAGVFDEAGSGAAGFAVGDRVYGGAMTSAGKGGAHYLAIEHRIWPDSCNLARTRAARQAGRDRGQRSLPARSQAM